MSEHERMLVQLGEMLSKIARPYRPEDDDLPSEVRTGLCQLGFPCNARLWARKRTLQTAIQPEWGGPGVTPPTAA